MIYKKCLIKFLNNNMNFKIDFPYPPVHYKSFNEKNFDKKPNLDLFF